jgi:hypothetical protein
MSHRIHTTLCVSIFLLCAFNASAAKPSPAKNLMTAGVLTAQHAKGIN